MTPVTRWISTEPATEALEVAAGAAMEEVEVEDIWEVEEAGMARRMELEDGRMLTRTSYWSNIIFQGESLHHT